jgi:hypothetical protein
MTVTAVPEIQEDDDNDMDCSSADDSLDDGLCETKPMEMIDPAEHNLTEILQNDFYTKYKHEKMDIPDEFMDRFHELSREINSITDRHGLKFRSIKTMIAKLFPRGKKDTKTKERVDETVARVYTEATRRMMKLMMDEGDTSALMINSDKFIQEHSHSTHLRTMKPDELNNIQAFYRAIYVAHRVIGIPCQGFRNHFMRIGSLLENSGIYYATGGRPAKTTLLRKEFIDKLTQSSRSRRNAKKIAAGEVKFTFPNFLEPEPECTNTAESKNEILVMLANVAGTIFEAEYQNMDLMNAVVEDVKREVEQNSSNSV